MRDYWDFWETKGDYHIWVHYDPSGQNAIWNCTKAEEGEEPPTTKAGYYSLEALLKLKGAKNA